MAAAGVGRGGGRGGINLVFGIILTEALTKIEDLTSHNFKSSGGNVVGRQGQGQNWQEPQIVEPVPIPDIFATGWVIQVNDDFVRIVCYADHPLTFPLGDMATVERQVVAKVVYPKRLFDCHMDAMIAGLTQPKYVGNGH